LLRPALPQRLADVGFLPAVVDIVLRYRWSTFLHQTIESIIRAVVESKNEILLESLIVRGEFLSKIIACYADESPTGQRGQLTNICNMLNDSTLIAEKFLIGNAEWRTFCDERLGPINRLNVAQLGTLSLAGEFTALAGGEQPFPDAVELPTTSMLENSEGDQYQPPMEPSWT